LKCVTLSTEYSHVLFVTARQRKHSVTLQTAYTLWY